MLALEAANYNDVTQLLDSWNMSDLSSEDDSPDICQHMTNEVVELHRLYVTIIGIIRT